MKKGDKKEFDNLAQLQEFSKEIDPNTKDYKVDFIKNKFCVTKIAAVLLLLFSLTTYSQRLTFNLYQDVKLAAFGDGRLNEAFTPNILSEVNLELRKTGVGYPIVGFTYEYASLGIEKVNNTIIKEAYQRYGVQLGYRFKSFIFKDFDAVAKVNWSNIERGDLMLASWGATAELVYNVNDWLGFSLNLQAVERNDKYLKYYNNANYTLDAIRTDISGFFGVVIKLTDVKFSGTPGDY